MGNQVARVSQKAAGERVPDVVFKMRERIPAMVAAGEENPFDWVDKNTADLFGGKGRTWLRAQVLPEDERVAIERHP